MGKFLRLLVGKWEGLEDVTDPVDIGNGYTEFFNEDREYFKNLNEKDLIAYSQHIEKEQIRPLAQLLMYDGLIHNDRSLLLKAKALFEHYMQQTGSFSFEDYGLLNEIERHIGLGSIKGT